MPAWKAIADMNFRPGGHVDGHPIVPGPSILDRVFVVDDDAAEVRLLVEVRNAHSIPSLPYAVTIDSALDSVGSTWSVTFGFTSR